MIIKQFFLNTFTSSKQEITKLNEENYLRAVLW